MKTLMKIEPQIKAPRVASLQSHASGGRVHVWREPYVSAYCSGRDAGGHDADERRFVGSLSAFICVHLRLINSYTLNKYSG